MEVPKVRVIGTSGVLDKEGSGFLSVSDRALLRRFGQLDPPRKDLRRVEESSLEATTNVSRVDGHPLKLSVNLLDRALLRKFPDAMSASSSLPCAKQPEDSVPSSAASIVPPHSEVAKNSTKKRKILGKGTRRRHVFVSMLVTVFCRNRNRLTLPVVTPPRLQSRLFLLRVFRQSLLYFTLVKDNAVPVGYLQEFLSLETPARRAAQRSQISATSISDSMAATALSELRQKADQRAAEVGSIGDQPLIAADLKPKKFRTKWQRAVYDKPTARKDAELAERDRWVQLFANLLISTDTPMGRLIRENPATTVVLGHTGRESGPFKSLLDGSLRLTGLASPTIGDNLLSTSRSGTWSLAFVELLNLFIPPSSSCRKLLRLRTS